MINNISKFLPTISMQNLNVMMRCRINLQKMVCIPQNIQRKPKMKIM